MSDVEPDLRIARVDPRALHALRRRVLRSDDPAISVADLNDDEATARHFGGYLGDRLVVSASFYLSTPPVHPELVSYQLRYMATDFDVQGSGYGARVLEFAEGELRGLGAQQVWANARDSALGFYASTGWTTVAGSEHVSPVTRLPHTVIFKVL